jgi:hypothetical protein
MFQTIDLFLFFAMKKLGESQLSWVSHDLIAMALIGVCRDFKLMIVELNIRASSEGRDVHYELSPPSSICRGDSEKRVVAGSKSTSVKFHLVHRCCRWCRLSQLMCSIFLAERNYM